jgi:hypothetical protein
MANLDLNLIRTGGHVSAQRSLYAMMVLNLALLALAVVQQVRPAWAQQELPVLRGSGLEIVDSQGRVRASISVLPAGKSAAGVDHAETVLLRLITERGRPSVKLGASEPTSGLSFAGPTGTQSTYVILKSSDTVSTLELRNENGRRQLLQP